MTKVTEVGLRPATPADASQCGQICYDAFKSVAETHNFPPDWPSPEDASAAMASILAHPGFFGVVAEDGRRIVGSCFLDERSPIAGLGPITVDPDFQGRSVGRRLMEHVLERADSRGTHGVRLVQASHNTRSLSLYAKLGFDVREPLSVMQGPVLGLAADDGPTVRTAQEADLKACNRLCERVHGYDRGRELAESIARGGATVAEHGDQILGYATALGFRGHAVGETNQALEALIGAAREFSGTGFLLPSRNGELLRWCLEQGLRIVQQMTYMSRGTYSDPQGAFLPSILA